MAKIIQARYWYITLRLHIGEFEKLSRHAIGVSDLNTAKKMALQDESHNWDCIGWELKLDDDGNVTGCQDCDFYYEIEKATPIDKYTYLTLKELANKGNHHDS